MIITEEYSDFQVDLIQVNSARYLGDYAINVFFSDGFNRIVDFKPFLNNALHPSIRKYLDEVRFKDYQIVDGNLNWNNYDLIFPIEDLYKGIL
ncbi:MAG: DUF2442 domain-containing protein [Bacteroidetes bacterium]|nr:DUF2442 domain-containing protein [Bacteroidota bacterium]